MLRQIKIYGHLSKLLKRSTFSAAVSSPAEAIRFLIANFPFLEQHIAKGYYSVVCDGDSRSEAELHHPVAKIIKIIPVIGGAAGGGGGGFFQVLAGVALLAAAVFLGPAAPGLFGIVGSGFFGATAASMVAGVGISLALGGVAQLLSPVPRLDSAGGSLAGMAKPGNPGGYNSTRRTELDPREDSFNFSGITQTSKPGVPTPIVLGEAVVGSVVISASVDTVQRKDNNS